MSETRTGDLVRAMCTLIDEAGGTVPLTTWWIAMAVGIDPMRAQQLLETIAERSGEIIEYHMHDRRIWIRPRHEDTWAAIDRCARKKLKFQPFKRKQ